MKRTVIIKNVTEEKLNRYLEKVGCKIVGDRLNSHILDAKGQDTGISIWNGKFEIGRFFGGIRLDLRDFWLRYYDDGQSYPMVNLVLPVGNTLKGHRTFISFYQEREQAKQKDTETGKEEG